MLCENRADSPVSQQQQRERLYDYIACYAGSQSELTLGRMCELVQVSRAGFYRHWLDKQPDTAGMSLRDAIQRVWLAHRFHGYRRVAVQLQTEGMVVSQKLVRRLMRDEELFAIRRRRFVATSDANAGFQVAYNLVEHLQLDRPDQLWVADLTYLRLASDFVFLAIVLDAWSRRAVGWKLGRQLNTELALGALRQAIAARQPKPGLVHHSDGARNMPRRPMCSNCKALGPQ